MSLKKYVLILAIANVAYFGYTQGWLKSLSGSDTAQREPERLKKQINQDAIRISQSEVATNKTITRATSRVCLDSVATAERWIVYMGPYTGTEQRDKKRLELRNLGLTSEFISKPTLKIGLSLGDFGTEAEAREALVSMSQKGVKTATVLLWQSSSMAASAQSECR